MSLRSRPASSGGLNEISRSTSYTSGHFKTYSFVHGDNEESLFDEDDDIKTRYLEKERALKKINEELERKSSEIFEKIEKYRYHESPSTGSFRHEYGQGDGTSNLRQFEGDYGLQDVEDGTSPLNASNRTKPYKSYSSRSYFDYSRPFEDLTDQVQTYSRTHAQAQSSEESLFSFNRRPFTANVISPRRDSVSSPISHTESSLRKIEQAKSLEGIEEKHQVRLQKATESVLKCVQNKLVNYEQRLADMHLQYREKIQENTMLEGKIKAMEEDRRRLLKTVVTLQNTTDKFSKSAESSKRNLNLKTQAFASLKKEMENMKKEIKQKNCLIQSLQTRLDRCTEENRRLKSQHHQSMQLNMRVK